MKIKKSQIVTLVLIQSLISPVIQIVQFAGDQKIGRGLILLGLRKRSLTPPNFIFEQQTESHMKAEVLS